MADNSRPKVFCIGLNKTGTTSIGNALEALGYKRSGWHDLRSRQFTHEWWIGRLDNIIEHTQAYGAFEDIPWTQIYREMAAIYPTAKFILTTRPDEQVWLRSISEHNHRRPWIGHRLIYGAYEPLGNEQKYLQVYRAHNEAIRAFFADTPDRLLELCIGQTRGWEELCTFLNISDIPTFEFPRANVTASHRLLLDIGRAIWHPIHQLEVVYVSIFFPASYAVAMHKDPAQLKPPSRRNDDHLQLPVVSKSSLQALVLLTVALWKLARLDLVMLVVAALAGALFQLPSLSRRGELAHAA